MVRNRSGWSRAPPVRRGITSPNWARRAAGGRVETRAAASSIARGSPSRRAQIAAMAGEFSAVRAKPNWAARARATKSWTASGAGSGSTGTACSAESRRTVRLVTSSVSRGQAVNRSAKRGAASRTCSRLSRTRRTLRGCRCDTSSSLASRLPWSSRPSPRAIAGSTSWGSRTVSSSTNRTPSPNSGSTAAATSSAMRVLPTPPGPVRVMRATSSCRSRSTIRRTSCSRPISGERGRGSADCGASPSSGRTTWRW